MLGNKGPKLKKNKVLKRFPFGWILAIIIFYLLVSSMNMPITGVTKEITYSEFYRVLKDNPMQIKSLVKVENELQGEFTDTT